MLNMNYLGKVLGKILDSLKVKFDISIAISETKLLKNVNPVHDIDLPDYH